MNVLNVGPSSDGSEEQFFVYTNILDQTVVFQRSITDVTPSSIDMVKVLKSATPEKKANKKLVNFTEPSAFDSQFTLPDTYKQKIMEESKTMMMAGAESEEEMNDQTALVQKLLDEESGDSMIRRIEEECKLEAERDELMLKQKIKDEIQDTIGYEEDDEATIQSR